MTLGSFTVRLPLYRIESQVTYHSPRIPSVFERMIMRLCAQYRDVQQVCELSLLAVFRDRLGVGDARELIEISMSNLLALDALEVPPGAQALECPLSELRLTADGESFLRNDRLPGRPRTETVEHLYDPLTNETVGRGERPQRATRVQQGEASPLAELLRPPSPAAHVEMALTRESYPWKQPATEIERVDSRIAEEPHREQTIVLSCRDDSVLSVHAPYDAALQKWLEHADPEVVWDALLADILMTDDGGEPLADAALLRDVQRVQPLSDPAQKRPPVRLRIVSAGADITLEPATPVVVLSPEVDVPPFVDHAAAPPRLVVPLHLPLAPGFAGASLALRSSLPAVDIAGAFRLYWAGQPRRCGLALTLAQSPSDAIWAVLREALETACATSDDPRVALLAALWRDPASVIDAWLAARAHRSFAELLTLGEACTTALALWLRGDDTIWKPLLNEVLVRRLGEAAARVLPGRVPHPEAIATLKRVKALVPVDGAALQTAYLMNATPVTSVDQLAALRAAMLPVAAIPGSLIAPEIQQLWLEQALDGAELALHGPHELVEPFQSFREAASAVHRDIGEQALIAARKDSVDPRTLTPRALSALSRWRNARDMAVHAGESIRFRELDHGLETWSRLARHHLAEPDTARRMVVLDTSALLERPALLRSLRPRDVPVMPQRVLNELDGLKKHEDAGRASRARDAIRQIEIANGIRFEAAHPHLLPSEWDAGEPDNDILSVAQYLRLSDVLLLSNDRNLRNKAKSLGLAAEDTTSYAAPAAAKATSTPTPARAKPNRR